VLRLLARRIMLQPDCHRRGHSPAFEGTGESGEDTDPREALRPVYGVDRRRPCGAASSSSVIGTAGGSCAPTWVGASDPALHAASRGRTVAITADPHAPQET
jgi:hypothetical protein